jgi:hypothetical protein
MDECNRHPGIEAAARIVHLAAVTPDEQRRQTIATLLELAEGSSPNACWDDRRAMDLLRSQSSAAELRSLGAKNWIVDLIFAEDHRDDE